MSEQKNFFSCDDVSHKGKTNTWFTPWSIIGPVSGEPFDLDPCSQSARPFNTAIEHYCHDKGDDGLELPWHGRIWCNPPYGKFTGKWLEKMAEHGNGIALVFARPETNWAQDAMKAADAVNFLKGRISFIREDGGKSNNAGTGSMLLAYGIENVIHAGMLPGRLFSTGRLEAIKNANEGY